MMSNGQPSVPMYGRRQHDMPYNPPPMPYQQHPYHGYPHPHLPQHYPPQPPPHWPGYYNMQPPMQRPYPGYPPMMNAPYPLPQPPHAPSMSPSRHPAQHMSPAGSARSHPGGPSPSMHNPAFPPPPPPAQQTPLASQQSPAPAPRPVASFMPFYPKVPWYSCPVQDFPQGKSRQKRTFAPQSSDTPVLLPTREGEAEETGSSTSEHHSADASSTEGLKTASGAARDVAATQPQAGATSSPASVAAVAPSSSSSPQLAAMSRSTGKTHPIVPVVPNIPSLNKNKKPAPTSTEPAKSIDSASGTESDLASRSLESSVTEPSNAGSVESDQTRKAESTAVRGAPKSWADLVRSKAPGNASNNNTTTTTTTTTSAPMVSSNGFTASKNESLADALISFDVKKANDGGKISFLKPRGLVNTGNMCYMNSVLQILVSNMPFYDFLDQVGRQSGHSFKSDTPMLDAMIMFLREFPVIDSATSVDQLNMRLKDKEFEEYGEAFIPEFVYEVIRRLPRFASMRRGHQQDAEEFLGFLLEQLHEECVRAMKMYLPKGSEELKLASEAADESNESGWLEVGPKQRASVTRSSGISELESPITKIFGGKLRSELRVSGAKNSVTLEPYQPLQLDIGSPQVNNIVDALKNLTKSETLHGDFNSPRGPGMKATKQVFVETLPPVLILHLKRFQYDNTGGTQKIWKKIGYPLDLEIPKEVFPPHKRGGLAAHGGLPKYRLVGVVYHHGKIASGGHYTVDLRRQNEREWIRFDDTVIRRIRSEEVAEGGSEEDPKVLAAALEQHKRDQSTSSSIFDQVREENEEQEKAERGWSQVNGASSLQTTNALKKWSGLVNGTVSPSSSSGKRTPVGRYSVKDNKVAYILFYQRLGY